jgi:sugar phosphate isomerase/epimerase
MNTSRRKFLVAGMAVLPASTVLGSAPSSGSHSRTKVAGARMKLGMVTYNLGKDWDIPTLIDHCRRTRFEGVELRTTHRHGVEVTLSPEQRAEVRRRFADSPVELFSLGSAFDYHTPDATRLRADMEATREYLQLAKDVGASGIKVRPNGLPKDVPEEKTLEQIGRSLSELGGTAADLGLQIRLEVHGTGTAQLPRIRRIMDIANHPNVGVCWNSNQTDLDGAGFDANFDLVRGRINEVHLRDLYLDEYPFRNLFQRLKESGYTGYTLAEIPESPDPIRVMNYFRGLWLAYQDRI